MRLKLLDTPRQFTVKGHTLKDYGKIYLSDGEFVSFVDSQNRECDFVARDWGFYLGPSLNDRLVREGFKVALIHNEHNQIYITAVGSDKVDDFLAYLQDGQNHTLLCWLDEWLPKDTWGNPKESS